MNKIIKAVSGIILLPLAANSAKMDALGATAAAEKPWFCHGLDCPSFEVVEKTSQYEKRQYSAGQWVSTDIKNVEYDKAVSSGFWKLFKYISGNNEDKQKIEMTAPVKVQVNPSQGPFCASSFTVSFYVPPEFQGVAPKPSDSTVYLSQHEAQTVFVAEYSGWNNQDKMLSHAQKLIEQLQKEEQQFEESYYYFSGYDSPYRLINRHNEIWVPSK